MILSLEELQKRIRRGPGLVIGPGLGTHSGQEDDCLKMLVEKFPHKAAPDGHVAKTAWEHVDILLQAAAYPESEIRTFLKDFFSNSASKNPQLFGFINIKWSAIISLSYDRFFGEALAQHLFEHPTKWSLTTVSCTIHKPALLTTPFYSLTGDIDDNSPACRIAISRSEYLTRKRTWSQLLYGLADYIRADPLLFVGTQSIPDRVLDFVDEMLRVAPRIPKYLVFLSGDASLASAALKNLVTGHCEILECSATTSELAAALDPAALSIYTLPLFAEVETTDLPRSLLEKIDDQALLVPKKAAVRTEADANQRNRLLDLLFRPNHLNWAPYLLGMEFRRDVCDVIVEKVKRDLPLSTAGNPATILIVGEAGIGKTVALRSAAFEIAQSNCICFWIRRSYGEVSGGRFDVVVSALNKHFAKHPKDVVFIVDDPIGNRVNCDEVEKSLKSAQFKCALVICVRKTEYFANWEKASFPVIDIPSEFAEQEFNRLPEYLVRLQIAPDIERATLMMPAPGVRESRDVLCALWYLLPQTKGAIEDSLTGEYLRLGQRVEMVISAIAQETPDSLGILRKAYEFVTAASGLENTAVPVEVLVQALGVSHADWAEQCRTQRPIWGLLYEDDYPSAETYAYRTRNYVVTEVLLRAINRGGLGATGQYRVLKELLASCVATTAPYKRFVLDILVGRRKTIVSRFNYEQAMDLYDTALAAYPGQLNIVKHHQCLVRRAMGGDPLAVYEELRHLIAAADDTHVGDNDSKANLHTSAAAALTQAVKDDKVNTTEGAERIFEHIGAAILLDQFSMHTHHVHASALIRLAASISVRDPKTSIVNLERASRLIDRALMLLSPIANRTLKNDEAARLFEGLYDDLAVAIQSLQEFKTEALEIFETTGGQHGLALWARLILRDARRSNRGQAYRKVEDAYRDIFKRIAEKSMVPVIELRICRAELVVSWHLDSSKGPVFWEQFLEDLQHILQTRTHVSDVVWVFYLAVAYYNLRKFPEAGACFQKLRMSRLDREFTSPLRCVFLGDKTEPQILQGVIKDDGGGHRHIYSSVLGTDIPIRRGDFTSSIDEVKHFKIAFNFNGPLAMNPDAEIEVARIRPREIQTRH